MTGGLPVFGWMLALLVLCLCRLDSACASQEEHFAFLDCSGGLREYAEAVAALNAEADGGAQVYAAGDVREPTQAVLCRTDGAELTLLTDGLACAVAGPDNCYTLYYASSAQAECAVAQYRQQGEVLYAELDAEVTAAAVPEQESVHDFHSWGAARMNLGSYVDFVNEWGGGSALVAVVDSGVCRHPLLSARMVDSGYDYVDGDDDATDDLNGHGTHVAGIVVDCTPALPVRIYPIRVLNAAASGKMSNVVNAIREATVRGVDVINLSIESHVASEALDMAIREAVAANVAVVVAAGNSACDTAEISPAHLQDRGVLVVGAAEAGDSGCVRASYSNYGTSVDLYAFGTSILSCSGSGGYAARSGTSMAAPHVSALCAMLRLLHPGMSPSSMEVRVVAAAAIGGGVFVPDAESMIPRSEGLLLRELKLHPSQELSLPTMALPLSSRESLTYTVEDSSVAVVESGTLRARGIGTTVVHVACTGLEEASFLLCVDEDNTDVCLKLPVGLLSLEDGAFAGDGSVEQVILPEGLLHIGSGAFEGCDRLRLVWLPQTVAELDGNAFSDAVVVCAGAEAAAAYCQENGIQYILTQCAP